MKAPKIDIDDASNAWLLPFARRQLERFKKLLPMGLRRFTFPTGEKVTIWWGMLDRIRIEGVAATFLRAWANFPAVSVWADLDAVLSDTEDFVDPDWSANFKTFAYWNGDEVEVKRGDVTHAITGSTRTPDDAHTSSHTNLTAGMNDAGTVIVTMPVKPVDLVGGNPLPIPNIAFRVTRWNSDTGAFATTDVPFPPEVSDIVDFDYTRTDLLFENDRDFADGYPGYHTAWFFVMPPASGCPSSDQPAGGTIGGYETPFVWRAFINRPAGNKIFLHVRHAVPGTSVLITSTISAAIYHRDLSVIDKVFEYGLDGTWTLISSISATHTGVIREVWGTWEDGSFSVPQGTLLSSPIAPHRLVVFDEAGGMHIVSYDTVVRTGTTTFTPSYNPLTSLNGPCTGGGVTGTAVNGPPVFNDTADGNLSFLDAVDLTLDGEAWIENVGFTALTISQLGDGGIESYDASGGINVLAVSSDRRGAITASYAAGTGRSGTIWRWDDAADEEWTQTTVEAVKLDKSRRWMFRGTDNNLVYKDGAQVFDGSGDDSLKVYLASDENDGRVTAQHDVTETVVIPPTEGTTITVQGGSVNVPGFGDIAVAAPLNGISLDGLSLVQTDGAGGFVSFTVSELEALFGVSPVTITPNGVHYELTSGGTEGSTTTTTTTHYAAVEFDEDNDYAIVEKYAIPRSFTIDDSPRVFWPNVAPDEFVL